MTYRLMLVVTEDWYLWSHRVGLAVAARDAGYDVTIVTRVGEHGERIRALGLDLVNVDFARGLLYPRANLRTVGGLCAVYRRWAPHLAPRRHQAARARLRRRHGAGADGGHCADVRKRESARGQAGPALGARLGHAPTPLVHDGAEPRERAVRRIPWSAPGAYLARARGGGGRPGFPVAAGAGGSNPSADGFPSAVGQRRA